MVCRFVRFSHIFRVHGKNVHMAKSRRSFGRSLRMGEFNDNDREFADIRKLRRDVHESSKRIHKIVFGLHLPTDRIHRLFLRHFSQSQTIFESFRRRYKNFGHDDRGIRIRQFAREHNARRKSFGDALGNQRVDDVRILPTIRDDHPYEFTHRDRRTRHTGIAKNGGFIKARGSNEIDHSHRIRTFQRVFAQLFSQTLANHRFDIALVVPRRRHRETVESERNEVAAGRHEIGIESGQTEKSKGADTVGEKFNEISDDEKAENDDDDERGSHC